MFIDELDAVGGRRDSFRGSNSRQTINQLLNEIGGFRGDEGVLILAATNLKKVLDPALVRAGRFDLEIRSRLIGNNHNHYHILFIIIIIYFS